MKRKNYFKKVLTTVAFWVSFNILNPIKAFATPTPTPTSIIPPELEEKIFGPINMIVVIFAGITASVGVFWLVKGGGELFGGYKERDSMEMQQGLRTVVSGLGMAAITTILAVLGFKI